MPKTSLPAASVQVAEGNYNQLPGGAVTRQASNNFHDTNSKQHPMSAPAVSASGPGQYYPVAGSYGTWGPSNGWQPPSDNTQEWVGGNETPSEYQSGPVSGMGSGVTFQNMQQTTYPYSLPLRRSRRNSTNIASQWQMPADQSSQHFGQTSWSVYNPCHQGYQE